MENNNGNKKILNKIAVLHETLAGFLFSEFKKI